MNNFFLFIMVDIFVFQHSVGLTISEGKVCSEEDLATMMAGVGCRVLLWRIDFGFEHNVGY